MCVYVGVSVVVWVGAGVSRMWSLVLSDIPPYDIQKSIVHGSPVIQGASVTERRNVDRVAWLLGTRKLLCPEKVKWHNSYNMITTPMYSSSVLVVCVVSISQSSHL